MVIKCATSVPGLAVLLFSRRGLQHNQYNSKKIRMEEYAVGLSGRVCVASVLDGMWGTISYN